MNFKGNRQLCNADEIQAINHLLQYAQKRPMRDDSWHAEIHWEDRHYRNSISNKNKLSQSEKQKEKRNNYANSLQKREELKRLKYLMGDQNDHRGWHQSLGRKQEDLLKYKSAILSKNVKIKPFESSMTFYQADKQQKQRIILSSMTFYPKTIKKQPNQEIIRTHSRRYRIINPQQLKLSALSNSSKTSNNVIYFKPNKSQTIRELLNHMKIQKQKNNHIILNSTHRDSFKTNQMPDVLQLSNHELKQINKYRKFVPFKEDQELLLGKISDNQNVWMKKFKESWQRKKYHISTRQKSYFKRLIVKD